MIFKMFETGPLKVNTYLVADEKTKETAVFDPGGDTDRIISELEKDNLITKYILNTHGHFDHVGGNKTLQAATGGFIMIHRDEAPDLLSASRKAGMFGCSADDSQASGFLEEGDILEMGSIQFNVLDLRGHSPAGLGFLFEEEFDLGETKQLRKAIICGDALFAGSIGRTDFSGGNLELLLENIRTRIFTLPEDTLVFSGHGPVTTVGREKQYNPFFQN